MDKYDMMIVEQIKVMLEEKGLEYEDDGEGIVTSGFKRYNFLYHVREDSLDFRVLIKKEVPEECMDEMLKLLNYANGITKDGHWELMGNHVYYRIYTDRVYNKEVSDWRINDLLVKCSAAIDVFYTGIEMVCEGILSGKDAFQKLVMKRLMEE